MADKIETAIVELLDALTMRVEEGNIEAISTILKSQIEIHIDEGTELVGGYRELYKRNTYKIGGKR
jgi:hypothetical protein